MQKASQDYEKKIQKAAAGGVVAGNQLGRGHTLPSIGQAPLQVTPPLIQCFARTPTNGTPTSAASSAHEIPFGSSGPLNPSRNDAMDYNTNANTNINNLNQ